jgi:hypothetical protein
VKFTLESDVDIYGFAIPLRYITTYADLDTSTWDEDNPGVRFDLPPPERPSSSNWCFCRRQRVVRPRAPQAGARLSITAA